MKPLAIILALSVATPSFAGDDESDPVAEEVTEGVLRVGVGGPLAVMGTLGLVGSVLLGVAALAVPSLTSVRDNVLVAVGVPLGLSAIQLAGGAFLVIDGLERVEHGLASRKRGPSPAEITELLHASKPDAIDAVDAQVEARRVALEMKERRARECVRRRQFFRSTAEPSQLDEWCGAHLGADGALIWWTPDQHTNETGVDAP